MSAAAVDFRSPYTIAAMREIMRDPSQWYSSIRYHRSILKPAIDAGFIREETGVDPGRWKNGRRYQLTPSGVLYMRAAAGTAFMVPR